MSSHTGFQVNDAFKGLQDKLLLIIIDRVFSDKRCRLADTHTPFLHSPQRFIHSYTLALLRV